MMLYEISFVALFKHIYVVRHKHTHRLKLEKKKNSSCVPSFVCRFSFLSFSFSFFFFSCCLYIFPAPSRRLDRQANCCRLFPFRRNDSDAISISSFQHSCRAERSRKRPLPSSRRSRKAGGRRVKTHTYTLLFLRDIHEKVYNLNGVKIRVESRNHRRRRV